MNCIRIFAYPHFTGVLLSFVSAQLQATTGSRIFFSKDRSCVSCVSGNSLLFKKNSPVRLWEKGLRLD